VISVCAAPSVQLLLLCGETTEAAVGMFLVAAAAVIIWLLL